MRYIYEGKKGKENPAQEKMSKNARSSTNKDIQGIRPSSKL